MAKDNGFNLENVLYFGDDINDINLLNSVGFSVSASDSVKSVKKIVNYITKAKGGEGVIREVYDLFF